jgi:hypothetical protein
MVGGGWWNVDRESWFVPRSTLNAPLLHPSSFIFHRSSFILESAALGNSPPDEPSPVRAQEVKVQAMERRRPECDVNE